MKHALVAGLLTFLVVAPALAQPDQPDVLPKEFACMSGRTKFASKFWLAKGKCVSKCLSNVWRGIEQENNCLPPTFGGVTALCVNDTVFGSKGAENKFEAAVMKVCVTGPGADCPDCYAPDGCGLGPTQDLVQAQEGQLDTFIPGIFCERTGADRAEQKCQLNTAKVVTKYFGTRHKCYTKCFVDERSGGDPALCLVPATAEKAVACLATAEQKAIIAIDKYCDETLRPGSQPDCGASYPGGAFWTNAVNVVVDGMINPTFCASPSGAFVD